jgi:phage FluMu protein gp41
MNETKTVVVRMAAEDFERLEAEARRLGVRPGTAARILLRQHLCEAQAAPPEGGRAYDEETAQKGIEAIRRIRAALQEVGPIDTRRILRESRKELEERGNWQSRS